MKPKYPFMSSEFSLLGTIVIIQLACSLDCIIYDLINASSYFKWLWVTFINKSINHVCNWEILLGYLFIASQFPRSQKCRKSKSLGTLIFLKFEKVTKFLSKVPSKSRFLWLDNRHTHTHMYILYILMMVIHLLLKYLNFL